MPANIRFTFWFVAQLAGVDAPLEQRWKTWKGKKKLWYKNVGKIAEKLKTDFWEIMRKFQRKLEIANSKKISRNMNIGGLLD